MPLRDGDRETIEALADLLDEKDLTAVEFESGDVRIRVARERSVVGAAVGSAPQFAAQAPVPSDAPAAVKPGELVLSPMVGTLYLAPSPDSPPYVQIGDRVQKGQVICIIEAMKLMNEIECEHEGVLAERLTENGQAVEFEQPLFRIETS